MEWKPLKKYLNIFVFIVLCIGINFSLLFLKPFSAHGFFEDQIQYKLSNHWFEMLGEKSEVNRFEAISAFLLFPDWSLPILRNAISNTDEEHFPWPIVMLIGMIGDTKDIPPLLELWKNQKVRTHSNIWLGSMKRIYMKTRISGGMPIEIKNMKVNHLSNYSKAKDNINTVILKYLIENRSDHPRFIRSQAHFWKTRTKEDLNSKFFWMPAKSKVDATFKTNFVPVDHTNDVRLDFRVWEIGFPREILHEVFLIPLNKMSSLPSQD